MDSCRFEWKTPQAGLHMSKQRRARIRLVAAERSELERLVAARTSTQQAAYRAEIILRVAAGQTDAVHM